jgi:hypothetical protein
MAMIFVISGCTSESKENTAQNSQLNYGMSCAEDICGVSSAKVEVEKIEIYHFHATSQCASCIAVGALAEETVNTYYSKELKSGKIVFAQINAELPENAELAKKYGVTGSSLWIGVYTKDGQFKAEQNINVWYKINDKEEYMAYLKEVIDKRLTGDLS